MKCTQLLNKAWSMGLHLKVTFLFLGFTSSLGLAQDSIYESLRFMTFNIRTELAQDPGEREWAVRRGEVAHGIRFQAPDVLGLQETTPEQLEYIHQELGDSWQVSPLGQILFHRDKFVFIESGRIDLIADRWGDRYSEWIELERVASGKRFIVLNNHWGVDSLAQQGSAEIMVKRFRFVSQDQQRPTILMGDLNVQPGSRPLNTLLENTPLKNFFWGATFNAWGGVPAIQLDYIMGFKVTSDSCYIDGYQEGAEAPSDHRAIVCNLRLE
ncbi:endonuclease/exonuclease/phosphatase family protein [Pseudobacteriovorax antillogorgiicola]|uniref:Metal-dependent hydrolase, endonuclease/exonuclease/phosphatase family n=1 Tax=Pseudobacteriovorax antillogorgiicola TaxID=1513793 RepID=A0A1Y6BD95_9BACT|nr:endonuclease/exonuclease/phosphatase family protein [Pseudobacteriovorax antillogorgiicola]TCS57376.1 endonuclease/exonuclease/phosphatase family metal-dependent hydrolase [Pseudobacteriovorax antillogorgiicola]SMF01864.1 Metal-dependent hydrolase, endonuclease/exonuclease/phosphatase family [Pseudobacteriovorax antillogorgiicola]